MPAKSKDCNRSGTEAQLIAASSVIAGPWRQPGALPRREGGEIRLTLTGKSGVTRLETLYHAQPLRVLFPFPSRGDIFQAAIACVSGGLVGGDRLASAITLRDGARAVVIGQAAEKIYRSLGADCLIDNILTVDAGSWLEWLPQETILFDAARLRRTTQVRLAPGARFMGGDMIVFGRKAHDEKLKTGLLHDAWEFRDAGGKLIWKDALHMDGDLESLLGETAAFDSAEAYGSLFYAGPDAAAHLDAMRDFAAAQDGLRIGATILRDILITRFIGQDALALRNAFAQVWAILRERAGGLPPILPRLWAI